MKIPTRGNKGAATPVVAASSLEVKNLGRTYGVLPVLAGLNFNLQAGQVLLVTGPNGSGKTTLLRMLAGLSRPTAGQVFLNGRDLFAEGAVVRQAIGYVGHLPSLYGDLTGRENLQFFARLYDVPATVIPAALERVNMTRRADSPAGAYSRGMQQRLALARALLHRPTLLILDEPLTGLDSQGRLLAQQFLMEHSARGGLAVVASHDAHWTKLAHVVLELDHGPQAWLLRPGGRKGSEENPGDGQTYAGEAGSVSHGEGVRSLPGFFTHLRLLTAAELLGSWRNLTALATVPLFALLVLLLFSLTLRPADREIDFLLPGLLWTGLTFAALSGQFRPFLRERVLGALEGLIVAPVDRLVLYASRLLSAWFIVFAVSLVMAPLFFAFWNWQSGPVPVASLLGLLALGTFALTAVAVAATALAVQGRGGGAGEGLLSLLALPLLLPVLMAVAQATEGLLAGQPFNQWESWFNLLLACGIVFSMLPAVLYDYLMEV